MSAAIPRVTPGPDRTKACVRCLERFPLDAFHREATSPDGRRRECVACRLERRAALQRGARPARPWEIRRSLFTGTETP